MSKGPGRWQRAILDAIQDAEYDLFPVQSIAYEHLDREPTRAELVACRRAVKTLAIAGKVRAVYERFTESACELCVTRPDAGIVSFGRRNAPGWITWLDGNTSRERWPDRPELWR